MVDVAIQIAIRGNPQLTVKAWAISMQDPLKSEPLFVL